MISILTVFQRTHCLNYNNTARLFLCLFICLSPMRSLSSVLMQFWSGIRIRNSYDWYYNLPSVSIGGMLVSGKNIGQVIGHKYFRIRYVLQRYFQLLKISNRNHRNKTTIDIFKGHFRGRFKIICLKVLSRHTTLFLITTSCITYQIFPSSTTVPTI